MRRGDFFAKNVFHGRQILWGKFIGGLFYTGELMIRSYQGGGVSQNAFSSNLNTVNLKNFPNHGEYSFEDKALTIL